MKLNNKFITKEMLESFDSAFDDDIVDYSDDYNKKDQEEFKQEILNKIYIFNPDMAGIGFISEWKGIETAKRQGVFYTIASLFTKWGGKIDYDRFKVDLIEDSSTMNIQITVLEDDSDMECLDLMNPTTHSAFHKDMQTFIKYWSMIEINGSSWLSRWRHLLDNDPSTHIGITDLNRAYSKINDIIINDKYRHVLYIDEKLRNYFTGMNIVITLKYDTINPVEINSILEKGIKGWIDYYASNIGEFKNFLLDLIETRGGGTFVSEWLEELKGIRASKNSIEWKFANAMLNDNKLAAFLADLSKSSIKDIDYFMTEVLDVWGDPLDVEAPLKKSGWSREDAMAVTTCGEMSGMEIVGSDFLKNNRTFILGPMKTRVITISDIA